MQCIFCDDENVRARRIFDNGLALAFPSSMPITPGHVLVVPKRHAATMDTITQNDGGIVEYEPRKFLYRTGSRAETPQEELLQVAALIRTAT